MSLLEETVVVFLICALSAPAFVVLVYAMLAWVLP